MYKYILFDFDGTVFDTVEGITKSARYALNKFGIEAELDFLRQFAGPPLVDKFMEVYDFTKEQAEQATFYFKERYQPIGLHECCIFPGIKEMLQNLRDAGFVLGIATSKPQSMAEQLLERHGLSGCFDAVCGSEPGLNNNAKWEVVLRAMQACGAEKETTVLVGDTKYDAAGARKAGIPCIGVRWGYAAEGELEQTGVPIAETMEELYRMLTEG